MRFSLMIAMVVAMLSFSTVLWCELVALQGINYCPASNLTTPENPSIQTVDSSGTFNFENLENTDGQGAYLSAGFGFGNLINIVKGTLNVGTTLSTYFSMLFGFGARLPLTIIDLFNWTGWFYYALMFFQVFSRHSGGNDV